jgi:hypothetical protein
MPDRVFVVLLIFAVLVFSGISVILLVRPSLYLRRYRNPWMEDTPWNRAQMRAVGLVFSLFMLVVLTGIGKGASKSALLEGFHNNILVALWITFLIAWVGGILSWILWRFPAIRTFVRNLYSADKLEDPAWERRMTTTFCSLLSFIVVVALFLAAMGYHP